MDRRYDTYCGLYCGACYVMIANRLGAVSDLAKEMKMRPEELTCFGCKTDVLPERCASCKIRACARGKNVRHCGECAQFPCEHIDKFSKGPVHAREVQDQCRAMKECGVDRWSEVQEARWTCPDCGTPFSWYVRRCPSCGRALSGFTPPTGGPV